MAKTIHFVSLGCAKNRVDTEVMLGVSDEAGLELVDDPADADVLVVNTCGFIEAAKEESIGTILTLGRLRSKGRCEKLVVTGCLSQRYPEQLAKELPEVDHLLGSSDMLRLREVLAGGAPRVLVGNPASWILSATDPRRLSIAGHSAFVKIAEGCDRSCAFCAIPEIRGQQRSRPVDDVVREVEGLVAGGTVEVCLVSQDTVAYGRDLPDAPALAELVGRVADVPGVGWVRLHYLYPETLRPELLALLREHPRVLPYVDMPLQHASDAMLRRMRRGHGGDRLRRVVGDLREKLPDLVLRSTFIVGHPGEDDADFRELCDLVRWARFDHVGVFLYSPEEGTRSFEMDGAVPVEVAQARHRELMELQRPISGRLLEARVGTEVQVLVEGTSDESEHLLEGRFWGQAPEVDGKVYLANGEARPGALRRALVTGAADYDLVADLLSPDGTRDVPPGSEKPQRRRPFRLPTVP